MGEHLNGISLHYYIFLCHIRLFNDGCNMNEQRFFVERNEIGGNKLSLRTMMVCVLDF